ncbi:MAG: carboxypeptidase-like regulatory domain-containing protein [Muribaculaceae bacterium]
MTKRILCILASVALLMAALPATAQVRLSGKVTDDGGRPIEFASVRVEGSAIGTNTDTEGAYKLSVPARDTVMVVFSCIGYSDVRRRLVKPKGEMTLNAKLYEKTQQLKDLEVTEFKKQTGQMQTIDATKLKLTPDASGGSVEAVLTTMAGVSTKNEMSSQYMVRGGTYDENSVYINGIEIYRPQLISSGQQEGLSIINPDLVDNVSFSTGGFSADYGDKMSSVLDITYREPEALEGALAMSLMGGSVALGQGSKRFSQIHGFRYKRNSSLLGSLETKGEYDPQYFDYQTNLNFKISSRWKASFLGNISVNNYRFTPETRETSFGTSTDAKQFKVYFDGQEKDKFETYFGALSLNYRHSKSSDFTLLASGYLTNELVGYDIHGEYWLDEAGTTGSDGGESVGGELGVGKYHEHARNRLKASVINVSLRGNTSINHNNFSYGLSWQHESIHDRTREWEQRDSAGYSLPHTGEGVNMVYNVTSKHNMGSNRLSVFALDSYKIFTDAGMFTVNGGVRMSYWDFNKEFILSPRASVGFVPKRNEKFAFRFATGLYYQAPFYKEYREEVADDKGNTNIRLNTDIKSQRSLHFILGGDYTFRSLNRPFKLTAELYYKSLSNLIPYEIDNLKVVYSGVNSSKGYVEGVDFKFFGQFVEGTDSWLSFSLMKTQENLNGVKVPRPTDQRYSVALFFTDYFPKFPKMKFSLKAIFSDGLPMTSPRTTRDVSYFRAPAYKRVDIGVSYQLVGGKEKPQNFLRHFKSVWIGLDCFNLFDISNVSSYYWVTDVNDIQYAVPNYLTRRQLNVRLSVNF